MEALVGGKCSLIDVGGTFGIWLVTGAFSVLDVFVVVAIKFSLASASLPVSIWSSVFSLSLGSALCDCGRCLFATFFAANFAFLPFVRRQAGVDIAWF